MFDSRKRYGFRRSRAAPGAPRRVAPRVEAVERRVLFATALLSTADEALSVTVDAYGAFGANTTAGDAVFAPAGAAAAGTVIESAVYFGPAGRFLGGAGIAGTDNLPDLGFLEGAVRPGGPMATSAFDAGGFHVFLTQIVGGGAGGARLSQVYVIRNDGTSSRDLRLVRHVNTAVRTAGTAAGAGGGAAEVAGLAFDRELVDNGLLAHSDPASAAPPIHVAVYNHVERAAGARRAISLEPTAYAAGPAADGFAAVVASGGIPAAAANAVAGDADRNGFADAPYDAALSLQTDFLAVAPGETVTVRFVTDFRVGLAAQPPAPAGASAPPSATILPIADATEAGTTEVTFVVRYDDDVGIDASSLGGDDVKLALEHGAPTFAATLVNVAPGPDGETLSTYRWVLPSPVDHIHGWTGSMAGTVTPWIEPGRVTDTDGNPVFPGRKPAGVFALKFLPASFDQLPDLAPTPVELAGKVPAGGFLAGGKAPAARVRITNGGAARFAGTPDVDLVASTDPAVGAGNVTLGTYRLRLNLAPGASKVATLKPKRYPAGMPPGDYFLVARVDWENRFAERDETNNASASAVAVRVAPPFTDLAFAGAPTVTRLPLQRGRPARLLVPLRNAGNVPARGAVQATVFASADQTLGADDRPIPPLAARVSLKPGATRPLILTFTLPADLPPGQYFLAALLDAATDGPVPDGLVFSDAPVTVA